MNMISTSICLDVQIKADIFQQCVNIGLLHDGQKFEPKEGDISRLLKHITEHSGMYWKGLKNRKHEKIRLEDI